MEIMSRAECLKLLEIHRTTTVWDFIREAEDGHEEIDLDQPRARGKTTVIKSMAMVNGKVVAIGLCNGQKAKNDCYVYLIRAENGAVKIGFTDDVQRRFSTISTDCPLALELVGCIRTAAAEPLERELHQRYANKRIRGEWFVLTNEDVEDILHMNNGQRATG